ncbi:serine/threonine protein phosphatase 1 [Pararhizobium capsulatum DSM 1112]|uniref:Serine/threonine protein phosphatase 1 n=1 Tax=Pararhizobium capsulatum DSM 1112 TaxID=1121113 RepID=A0ABU0BL91_9HYPH|nr:metallophosphoesterase [Pararhizobium capsulatum]MDQ0318504.1 serine/threonine protein phosphatase 1 [Pararhizobium capsulatum DSM 1112]
MIANLFGFLRRNRDPQPVGQRTKQILDTGPDHLYAIGDVHGCEDLLEKLEAKIREDGRHREGRKWIVMLGDYVDRGPKSASVLDRLTARAPEGFQRFCLAGNHEEVMLDFLNHPAPDHRWLDFGGLETLYSYGIHKLPSNRQAIHNVLLSHIPQEHITFLETLPSLLSVPGICLVHAGIREDVPLEEQKDADLLWLRPRSSESPPTARSFVVVHGHTPVPQVEITQGRINIDTGAYMSAKLSAIRLSKNEAPAILQCD